jgi:hypothetical protein
MQIIYQTLCLALFTFPLAAQARPITYPGGWSLMTMNDMDVNSAEAYYTPDPNYSIGWRHDYWRDPKANMDAAQINYLLKRWNNEGSQGNLYLKPGAGVAYEDGESQAAVYGGIAADWEDRRYYISYSNEFLTAGDIYKKVSHTARVGIAPYEGDSGDLHTWLMLQADYDSHRDNEFSVTPLVRLFKGTTLGEAGVNLDGGVYFHLMKTF